MTKRATLAAVCVCLSACGGGSSPSSPSPQPSNPYTITITAAGASPREITVPPGTRVLFVNNASRPHNMTSDPHPDHDECPAINQAGLLQPGQSRETGNLTTVRTCGYHDHDDPFVTNLQGRIIIR
jgi:plastocyanin